MKLGVFDPVFGDMALERVLDRVVELGLEAVEIGAGNYPGDARCRPSELLADRSARERFASAFECARAWRSARSAAMGTRSTPTQSAPAMTMPSTGTRFGWRASWASTA